MPGTLGLTAEEAARSAARSRTERTRRAAATRRAIARGMAGGSEGSKVSAATGEDGAREDLRTPDPLPVGAEKAG